MVTVYAGLPNYYLPIISLPPNELWYSYFMFVITPSWVIAALGEDIAPSRRGGGAPPPLPYRGDDKMPELEMS